MSGKTRDWGNVVYVGKKIKKTPQHQVSSKFHEITQHFTDIINANAKSLQSCPTLCDPIDGSPPGFPIPGILQARTLEWVAISFSNA